MPRDDPLPLASLAAELLERAAARALAPDDELRALLRDLERALPLLRDDEPHYQGWALDEAALRARTKVKPS